MISWFLFLHTRFISHLQINEVDLAKRLMDWSERGFPELNDVCGQGLDSYTKSVIVHPQFSERPKHVKYINSI